MTATFHKKNMHSGLVTIVSCAPVLNKHMHNIKKHECCWCHLRCRSCESELLASSSFGSVVTSPKPVLITACAVMAFVRKSFLLVVAKECRNEYVLIGAGHDGACIQVVYTPASLLPMGKCGVEPLVGW